MSTDVHTLSGAYALDALAPEEAAEFRQHLEACQACRDEVRELQKAAAQMGAAEALAPPPDLKARILSAADRTPQQPPGSSGQVRSTVDDVPRRSPATWRTWLAAAAAAVVVGGAGAVGIANLLDDEPELSAAAAEVFQAEDARTHSVRTPDGGAVVVGVAPSLDEMAVDTRGLPELGEDRVYQLWTVRGDEATSVGVLTDPDEGAAMGLPEEGAEVAVTVEPAGGSEQPTTDPIVTVDPAEI